MGVGDGSGQLFVYGSYEVVKRVLENERLHAAQPFNQSNRYKEHIMTEKKDIRPKGHTSARAKAEEDRRGRVTRVVNRRSGAHYDLMVDRTSFWGSPFHIGIDGTRREVIAKYRAMVLSRPDMLARLPELRGKVLVQTKAVPRRRPGRAGGLGVV